SFKVTFFDEIYNLTPEIIEKDKKVEV
ncbi:MAG: hypothetical protein PWP22_550, partial [Thermoanaerobacter sp.]|nr:hypothetical protein [Thermoanaerobacter sp.]